MVFWGAEVKPEKPYIYSSFIGKLHLTQAIFNDLSPTGITILQCQTRAGKKIPISLGRLVPRVSETCVLNAEFDAGEIVTFSVIGSGSNSVHIHGYIVGGKEDSDRDRFDLYPSSDYDDRICWY